jgi:archaeal cell division control protein 6
MGSNPIPRTLFLGCPVTNLDLTKGLDPCAVSDLQSDQIYFPLYTAEEIRTIIEHRVARDFSQEYYPMKCWTTSFITPCRPGTSVWESTSSRRTVLNADHVARHEVSADDICAAYDTARYVHLSACVRALTSQETQTLRHIPRAERGSLPLQDLRCRVTEW